MPKPLKRALIALGAFIVFLLIVGAVVLWLFRSSFPQTRGTLSFKGLAAPVEILRDRYGVPHISAQNMRDLYVAQGFVTAQDRFWQMEFWRRIGAGRLSEYFGQTTLSTDKYLRTVGFRHVAEEDLAAMDSESRSIFEAYAEGVNDYIQGKSARQLGMEFLLLKLQGAQIKIEPWSPVDSLTWMMVMSQDLGGNMRRELYEIDLINALGLSGAGGFLGSFRGGEMPYIVPDRELPKRLLKQGADARPVSALASAEVSQEQLAALSGVSTRLVGGFDPGLPLALGTGPGIGSNNWVIAGSRTTTGKPILANDTHLGIQMPSIWYEVDLYCSAQEAQIGKNAGEPFHVRGFSFAGVPGVIIGHNDRIAWGVTNLNPDVEDLYIERINPANPNQYEVNGKWVDMKVRREEIKVLKQDDPVVILARETRHGPIITDTSGFSGYRGFALDPHGEFPMNLELRSLALKWTALQVNETFHAVILLNRARSFPEFRQALRYWDVPSQNFVYADVDGNIGYQTPGRIPIRKKGDGSVPAPGWTNDYEWTGYIPFDDLPFSYNPTSGYVATANQPVVSSRYRYFLGNDFDLGYRARRIVDMIEKAGAKISVADVEAMQGDVLNISAQEVIPYLRSLTLSGPSAEAREIMLRWDFRMTAESSGAAVYAHFWQALLEEMFKNKLPDSLWNPDTGLDSNSRLMNTVSVLLKDPRHPLWDNPTTLDVKETRDDILKSALEKGVKAGTKVQGKDMRKWRWGKEHTAVFRNQTLGKSGIGLVERIFNRGPVAVPGGFQQVFSTDWKPNDPFGVYAVSSQRQIVDLSNLAASVSMHTTGQSGHTGNRHYADMIKPWSTVRYHPTLWDSKDLQASRPDRLLLKPR